MKKLTVRAAALVVPGFALLLCFGLACLLFFTVTNPGKTCVMILKNGRNIHTFEPTKKGRVYEYFDRQNLNFKLITSAQIDTIIYN